MAKHEIKTTVSLDGEAQFRAALQHSEQALRKLNAELSKETSALGTNASAQQRATVRIDALKKKIAEQEKVVSTMRVAVAQATQQFGAGATTTTEWEIKLAKAETTLNKMNNELDTLNMSLENTGNTMEESAQQTANMAEGLNMLKGVAAGAAGSVKQVFDTMLSNVKSVVGEIISLTQAAMAAVGNYKGISDVYGGSDESIQRLLFGASGYGIDYSQVTNTIKNLVQRTDSGNNKEVDAALTALGIKESDYSSHWDYYEGVLQALAGVTDQSQRESLTRDLFGDKGFESVTRMMTHWQEMQGNISNADSAGAFLTQDQINAVDSYGNSIAELQTNLEKLKETVGAGLIITLGMDGLSKDATKTLQDVLALFNAANDGDAEGMKSATLSLSADVNILADDIAEAITTLSTIGTNLGDALKMSDNPIFATLGTTLEVFGDLVGKFGEWLKDDNNKQTLGKILNAAFINKMAEWLTGDSLTGWFTKILSGLTEIVVAVNLLRAPRTGDGFFPAVKNFAGAAGTAISAFFSGGTAAAAAGIAGLFGLDVLAGKAVDALNTAEDKKYYERFGRERGAAADDFSGVSVEDVAPIMEYITELNKMYQLGAAQYDGNLQDIFDQNYNEDDQYNPFTRLADFVFANGPGQYNAQVQNDNDGNGGTVQNLHLTVQIAGQEIKEIIIPMVSEGIAQQMTGD